MSDPGSRKIARRDFLNGVLLSSAAAACRTVPSRVLAATATDGVCDGVIGADPRTLRGGNLPSAFSVAHWLRDRRLHFDKRSVTLLRGCDTHEGSFPITDNDGAFDVVIVGAGLAGLSAAFYLLRKRSDIRILLLDANDHAGGNAGRDFGSPLPVVASTAGAYCAAPASDHLKELYREIDLSWEQHRIANPMYSYFFDNETPGIRTGHHGWNIDTYGDGLPDVPYKASIVRDLVRCQSTFRNWSEKAGAPTDPPESSDPRFDDLTTMTFDTYLTNSLKCDPIVSDFYTRYTIDCLGGTTRQVNAHSAISFLSSDYSGDLFAFPGGTSELARRLVRWLEKPGSSEERGRASLRLNAVALRVDVDVTGANSSATVTCFADGKFHRFAAKAVIIATQAHSARHLVEHLSDSVRTKAFDAFNLVPAIVANVVIRSAAPLVELGLGYNQYYWGSKYWADFVIADWTTQSRIRSDRPTVLTFIGGNTASQAELPDERVRLLKTPFAAYEASLKNDLSRIMVGTNFEFDRDVSAINLYRWGHSLIMPTPGFIFGNARNAEGRIDRAQSARRLASSPIGAVSFAGQDTEGTPSVESAIGSGHRAALESLARWRG